MNFYELRAKKMDDQEVSMGDYQGKVILVVNTASKCGFTRQFEGLENLYQEFKEDGLVILGFPCNQFANQDPGDNAEILDYCQKNYGVSFPMFQKIDVNGEQAHPIFVHLKEAAPGALGNAVKWNFTKFLINQDATKITRFAPTTEPETLRKDIMELLG